MTPAVDELKAAGVEFTLHPYEHDPSAPSYGLEAAEVLGVEPDRVFKTLMATVGDLGLVVAIIPVAELLDLKAVAAIFGQKRGAMAEVAAAERSSGYVAGGISPFGQRTRRPTAIDESATICDTIFVSGGRRGLDLELQPSDLISLLDSRVGQLTR